MIVSPLLQILAIYVATSLRAGLPLGAVVGAMIRRAERRHRQHVAQLMRSRTLQTVGSFAEQTGQGRRQHPLQCSRPRSGAGRARIDQLDPDRLLHLMPDNKDRARKVIDDARAAEAGPPDSGVDVRPQLPKNACMTMAGGLTTMEVERDTHLPSTGRRS
jgi:hypothetical protein